MPVLLTKGRVNYLINYPADAAAPVGQPVEAGGLRVIRLDRPEVPMVLLAGRRHLEGALEELLRQAVEAR